MPESGRGQVLVNYADDLTFTVTRLLVPDNEIGIDYDVEGDRALSINVPYVPVVVIQYRMSQAVLLGPY